MQKLAIVPRVRSLAPEIQCTLINGWYCGQSIDECVGDAISYEFFYKVELLMFYHFFLEVTSTN